MGLIDQWQAVNRELLSVCKTVCERTVPGRDTPREARLLYGFMSTATRTLEAVTLLYDHDLKAPAQALVRTLLEVRANFDWFQAQLGADPAAACQRVKDDLRLQRRRLAQAARPETMKTVELSPEQRAQQAARDQEEKQAEQPIRARYAPGDFDRLRRYGFTGLPIEERIARAGQSGLFYTNVYRDFSLMAHGLDALERQLRGGGQEPTDLVEVRDHVALSTAHMCARGIADAVNERFRCGLDADLAAVTRKEQAIQTKFDSRRLAR